MFVASSLVSPSPAASVRILPLWGLLIAQTVIYDPGVCLVTRCSWGAALTLLEKSLYFKSIICLAHIPCSCAPENTLRLECGSLTLDGTEKVEMNVTLICGLTGAQLETFAIGCVSHTQTKPRLTQYCTNIRSSLHNEQLQCTRT